jgi:hypothetical protein
VRALAAWGALLCLRCVVPIEVGSSGSAQDAGAWDAGSAEPPAGLTEDFVLDMKTCVISREDGGPPLEADAGALCGPDFVGPRCTCIKDLSGQLTSICLECVPLLPPVYWQTNCGLISCERGAECFERNRCG